METVIDIKEIMELLPHRYPFLLVDKIVDIQEESIIGIKNVTINEPFFAGHFPSEPIMPGVLQIEAMAQVAGVLAMKKYCQDSSGNSVYFMTIDKVKFRKPVRPGDTLSIRVKLVKGSGSRFSFKGQVFVDDKPVSEAEMMAMIGKS
jgi:beta-hydroxyacyl-ACP dehydratase FabZ